MHFPPRLRSALCAPLLSLLAAPVAAHPHIFIDTTLKLETDAEGHPAGVEVTWLYDELYSLMIFEDMGLDPEYDGQLTEAELKQLDGFDMQWVEGYAGDLYAMGGAAPLDLGAPQPRGTRVIGGRIETRHFRPFTGDAPQAVALRAYDPTYYSAYDLTGGVSAPEGCRVEVATADLDAARARVEKELDGRPETIDDFPEVGEAFADTAIVTCGDQ